MYSSMYKLVIGSKNASSWSLRPWLILKMLGEPFEEVLIPLGKPDSKERIRAVSPSGKVPLLIDGQHKVWDSLAIAEYLADSFPGAHLWPKDPAERALARSVAAEMHSGFVALREHLPMNFAARGLPCSDLPAVRADIERIVELWTQLRTRYYEDGPFLFGQFTIADAMFAPVASRFTTYQVALPPEAAAYRDHLMAMPAMQEWLAASEQELRQG
jgi:glutathione S-transferase